MKTLDEHNAERRRLHSLGNEPRPNGIACPTCGSELLDLNPMETFTSNPPQKKIGCPKCSYVGYRVA